MKIESTIRPTLFRKRGSIYVPDGQETAPTRVEAKGIVRAASGMVLKNLASGSVAKGSWELTKVPASTSQKQLSDWLIQNNLSPNKATEFAKDIRSLLNNPAARAVLYGVSAAGIAYVVIDKTSWSTTMKIVVTAAVAIIASGGYLLLRYFGWLN